MSQLRVSFFPGASEMQPRTSDPISAATLACSTVATLPGSWLTVPASAGQFFATFEAFGASIYIDIAAASPDPTVEPRQLVPRNGSITVAASAGFRISAVEASDIPTSANLVQPPIPAVLAAGQIKIVTTGTAVQLPSIALQNGLVVKSMSANNIAKQTIGGVGLTNTVDGTGNGYILLPGEAASFAIPNASLVYVNGTAGDIFTYEGN